MFMTRRGFIATGAAGLAASLSPLPAWALNEAQAKALITDLVTEINAVIGSGKSETGMFRDFERIFRRYADISYVAASAFGPDARRASAAQKSAFSDAFTGYIARKYGSRFREFIGGRLEVQDVRPQRNYFEVRTIAYLKGESPFEVSFNVWDRTGQDLFFNMFIEGINMMLTERTEIGAMLDRRRGDIDAMIADLRKAG